MNGNLTGNVFADAALLLGLGMTTIFTILFLIVWIGQSLIRIVNRYSPLPVKPEGESETETFSAKTLAAIVSAVEVVTQNKGTIESIKKID